MGAYEIVMTQENIPIPSKWSPRQVMLATIFVASVVLGFWILYRFRAVLFIFFVAILLGTAIKPAVEWLYRRRVPKLYGEILIYMILLAAIIGFSLLVLPLVLEQVTVITTQLSETYERVRTFMVQSPSRLLYSLGFRLPPEFQVEDLVQGQNGQAPPPDETAPSIDSVAQAFQYAGMISRGIFIVIAIFLMGFYWTLEGDRAIRSVLLLFPRNYREDTRGIIDAIQDKLGAYLFGQLILMGTVGGFQLVAYLIIGLPNALVLAIIAGVMEAVPTVGPILGALPAILIAYATDPGKVVWVLAATGVIQFLENYLLVPRVMDKSVGVSPFITLLSLAAFSSLLGLPGALLAIPFAAIIQLLINRFVIEPGETAQLQPEGRDYMSYLRLQTQEIAQDIRKQVRHKDIDHETSDDNIEDAIEELVNDLDRILSQVNQQEMNTR